MQVCTGCRQPKGLCPDGSKSHDVAEGVHIFFLFCRCLLDVDNSIKKIIQVISRVILIHRFVKYSFFILKYHSLKRNSGKTYD